MKQREKSVKNRQLQRQKQDAESIHLFKGKGERGGKADRQSEKRAPVLTEAINRRTVHWKTKRRKWKEQAVFIMKMESNKEELECKERRGNVMEGR